MKLKDKNSILLFVVIITFVFSVGFHLPFSLKENEATGTDEVARIFKQNCSVSGCHKGAYPPMNLNLKEDKFLESLLNVSSQQLRHLKLVDTENPQKSYLLMKIRGDNAIAGRRMPLDAPALNQEEIQIIEGWIMSLKEVQARIESAPSQKESKISAKKREPREEFKKPSFWGTRLVNLPTTRSIGKGSILFRISHRYFPAVTEGYDTFYGLDGPAAILISLGYGINDNLSVSLGRSNRFKEAELSFDWLILKQGKKSSLPLSASLHVGGSIITQTQPGKSTFRSENMKLNLKLSVSHQVSDSLSFLLVPSYSSNTNHWESSSEGTFALGTGARYMFLNDFSLLVEWIPVLAGYKTNTSGWGLGLEKKIGGHVFQVFVLNTFGLTSAQFIPGGDLRLADTDFRFGFNIFRWF